MRRVPAALALLLAAGASPASAANWPQSPTITAYSSGALAPYLPRGGVVASAARCGSGASTYLECETTRARTPQHDVDLGRTTLILRSRDGRELLRETVAEIWECLGFDARTRRYVLVSKNEHGTKVTLRALVYLDEDQKTFQDSAFDREEFEAVAALPGPEVRFLALIGAPSASDKPYELYALDLDRDALRRLGPPPAPPPLPVEDLSGGDSTAELWPWESPDRWFTELEAGVWSFVDARTLRVSYGQDTRERRAKKRKPKTWKLD
jgi:hypothetical protein